MRKLSIAVAAVTMLTTGVAQAALDCARVQKLSSEGKRPADIARELGITTPEVQECMADEVDEPAAANAAGSIPDAVPLAPQRIPGTGDPIPRGPNQQ